MSADTLDDIETAFAVVIEGQCETQAGTVTPLRIQLPAGEATHFRCVAAHTPPHVARADLTMTTMGLLRGTDMYLIGFGHSAKLDSKYVLLEEKIANTFRWVSK